MVFLVFEVICVRLIANKEYYYYNMNAITVSCLINAPVDIVWKCWTSEKHVTQWNFASHDWHCPAASIDLKVGGEFHYTMAANDNSMNFDFWGTYQKIENEKQIGIILGDQRKLSVFFETTAEGTLITEIFEPELINAPEKQQQGWQMILDNFKQYAEQINLVD